MVWPQCWCVGSVVTHFVIISCLPACRSLYMYIFNIVYVASVSMIAKYIYIFFLGFSQEEASYVENIAFCHYKWKFIPQRFHRRNSQRLHCAMVSRLILFHHTSFISRESTPKWQENLSFCINLLIVINVVVNQMRSLVGLKVAMA